MTVKEYIDQAIKEGKSVTISYVKYGGELSTRKISDIKYSEEFGPDYICAYCHMREEDRTFKISRIQKVDGITACAPIDSSLRSVGVFQRTSYRAGFPWDKLNGSFPSKQTTSPINTSSAINSNVSFSTKTQKSPIYSGKKEKEGCYIATMAYGNYNHPKVLILRRYRDTVLLKSTLGQLFVKGYYTVSPHMVVCLKHHRKTNHIIRKILDRVVSNISKNITFKRFHYARNRFATILAA